LFVIQLTRSKSAPGQGAAVSVASPEPVATPPQIAAIPTPTAAESPAPLPTAAAVKSPSPLASPVGGLTPRLKPGDSISTISPPQIRGMLGSSHRGDHIARLAFDDDPKTAWITEGEGVGQTLIVHFQSTSIIASISIVNGNAADPGRFNANGRARTLQVSFSDGTKQEFSLEDKMQMQRFELQRHASADWARFEILSVYRGSRNNWTAISEIQFNR
jgi:hypothetical protein